MPDTDTASADDALLAAYAAGERAAAGAMVARFAPLALRVAQRMVGPSEAEDVAQEALLRLFRMAPGWQPGGARVTTWLYRVVVNLATDRLRKRAPLPLDAVAEPESGAPGAETGLQEASRAVALHAALARLPERQRQAVVLRHLEGLANPEIAEILNLGVEAVESLIARGKRALTADLAGRREELGYDD